jgi:hypothetical protein
MQINDPEVRSIRIPWIPVAQLCMPKLILLSLISRAFHPLLRPFMSISRGADPDIWPTSEASTAQHFTSAAIIMPWCWYAAGFFCFATVVMSLTHPYERFRAPLLRWPTLKSLMPLLPSARPSAAPATSIAFARNEARDNSWTLSRHASCSYPTTACTGGAATP